LDKVLIDQLLAEKKRKDFNDEDVDIQKPTQFQPYFEAPKKNTRVRFFRDFRILSVFILYIHFSGCDESIVKIYLIVI